MKTNFDRLLDLMIENKNDNFDYHKSSKEFYRLHGYGVDLDAAKSKEEKHIAYMYHAVDKSDEVVRCILEVVGFNDEQRDRLYYIIRAVERWYEKETKWSRIIPDELIDRIEKYVIG